MSVETFSTRIKGHTLESFLVEARKLRVVFEEAAHTAWRQDVVRLAAAMFDERRALACLECNPDYYAFDTIDSAQKELVRCYERGATWHRKQQLYKYGVKADVYPLDGQLLVTFHVDAPVLQELLQSQPWWDDASYPWAAWDPKPAEEVPLPEGVTFENWKERELLWASAMKAAWPVSYQVTILPPDGNRHRITDELLAEHMPTLDERISSVLVGLERSLPGVKLPFEPTREQWEKAHGEVLRMYLQPEVTIAMLRRGK